MKTCAIDSGGNIGPDERVTESKNKAQLSDDTEGGEDDGFIKGNLEESPTGVKNLKMSSMAGMVSNCDTVVMRIVLLELERRIGDKFQSVVNGTIIISSVVMECVQSLQADMSSIIKFGRKGQTDRNRKI